MIKEEWYIEKTNGKLKKLAVKILKRDIIRLQKKKLAEEEEDFLKHIREELKKTDIRELLNEIVCHEIGMHLLSPTVNKIIQLFK
ncbi:hypothetical protein GF385_03440 [Candidatus Dependentiae bacterium]|nr:hypothetical protein [Candidatus Dependentiae bacterium]